MLNSMVTTLIEIELSATVILFRFHPILSRKRSGIISFRLRTQTAKLPEQPRHLMQGILHAKHLSL
jgi:hypothetical protein